MKKLLIFFLTALLAFGVGWADEITYNFNSVSWGASPENWTGTANANQYSATQNPIGVQVTTGKQGMTVTSPQSYNNISKVVVTYTSTSKGVGSIKVSVGNTEIATQSISKSQTRKELTYDVNNLSGNVSFVPSCTANSYSINSISITYNSAASESVDFSLVTGNVNTYDSYVLVYGSNNAFSTKALGTSGVNETTANGYTCSNNVVSVTDDSEINILTFESAGDGRYYIKGSDGNYWGCLSTMLSTSPTKPEDNDKYKWQITVAANGDATIMNVGNTNTNYPSYLKYRAAAYGFKIYSATQSDAFNGKLYSHAGETPTVEAPTFSPDGGTFTGSVDVTITSLTEGATIYYTTDDTDPVVNRSTSSIENGGTVTLTQNGTLKAIATLNGVNSPIATSQSYTVTSGGGSGDFTLVTDVDDLSAGDEIIFVNSGSAGSAFAMSTTQNDNNRGTTSVTVTDNNGTKTVVPSADTEVFTLESGWYFKTHDNKYIYAASSSKNYLRTQDNKDNNAKATISVTSAGVATIEFQGTNTRNLLSYNNSNNIFSCYSSSQQPVYIYHRSGTPKVATPTFSPDPSVTYTSAQVVTISSATEGATIVYSVNNGEMQSAPSPVTITVSSTSDIEAYATLTGYDDSDVATATYNINLTPTMTVAPTELTFGTLAGDQLTVTTSNLTAGVNATVLNTGYSANTDKWTVTPNTLGAEGGSMTVNYGGRLLKSDNTVRMSSNGVADVDVPVHYKHSDPIYIVTNANNWDFTSGMEMTRNGDTYSYTLNATADTYLVFTKKVGDDVNWNTNYLFGPVSSGDWWLTEESVDTDFDLDSTAYHVVKMHHGTYTITLNAATNQMRIVADVHAPVFSLAEGRYYEAQTLEMTCDTEGAHIYYTTDGSTPSATNGTLYTGAITVDATMTVKAVAIFGNITSPVTTANYTIQALGGDDYILTNMVTANDEYVLVYSSNTADYAMGAFNSGNYYATTTSSDDFELNGTIVTRKSNNVNVLTLEPAGNGKYYIVDQDGYYLYYNSGNYVHRNAQLATDNDAYKWNITFDENNIASIQNVGTSTRYLRCNAQSSRYACYESTSNAKLYKRAISEPRIRVSESTLDLGTVEAGGASVSNTFTVHGMNLTQDVTLSIEGENFTVSPTTISAADANNGYVTVTVTYSGLNASANATVTVNSQCDPKTVAITAARELLAVTISPASGTFSGSTMSGITIESNASGATIYYSLDNGQTWNTYDGNGITVTAVSVGDRPTVQAYATYNGETSATVTATYERVAKSTTLFEKVTSDSQIKAGNKYIFVYEDAPYALSGAGYTASVAWNNGNIDIAGTSTTVFTLGGSKDAATFSYKEDETTYYLSHNDKNTSYSTTANTLTINQDGDNGYYVKEDKYMFCYNAGNDPFRWYTSKNGSYAYLYVQGGQIEAPEILPASGTYYENQTVSISDESDDVTIWYTTDGSDPATSATRQQYNGQFNVNYVPGTTTTIIAVAIDEEDAVSEPATVVYTWGTPSVVISPDSRNVTVESVTVTMTGTPANATIYYTTDGSTPTTASEQYNGAFNVSLPNVGDVANVKAIAVYNGQTSEVATATYTRVEKVIDVKAPFFSPLAGTNGGYNGIYYGEQTLQIGCTTPNADIYYEIVEVTGETVPAAVADPTKQSSYYDATQAITMEVGKSYRVKAIAYVGGFASTVSEGYYIIKTVDDIDWPSASQSEYYVTSCKEFNELSSTYEGDKFIFVNPVQVVYHSTYVNNGRSAEFCYVRDNTDYACVYFGKADTHNYHIFKMGDWIAGNAIEGPMDVYEHNYHNQLGTSNHTINATLWPTEAIGWTEIVPETTTCTDIASGTPAAGKNKWGHYVHVRYSTMSDVHDEKGYQSSGDYDMKHTGSIQDLTDVALNYYDKFYLWSAGNCRYGSNTYTINCKGDYTQEFFDTKKNAGATFDVFGVVDWYGTVSSGNYNGNFQVCPIDFLWTYKPVITVTPGETVTDQVDTYAVAQTVTISAEQPEWAAENVVIYYKTDDMDDWAEYTGPFVVSSTTSVQTYAEVYAKKNDAAETDYNDYVRSVTVSQDFKFQGIKDPIITPDGYVIEVVTGDEKVTPNVTISTNPESPNAITLYTTNGDVPTLENGTEVTGGTITLPEIQETTTITAISYLPDANGNPVLWSNAVTETYTFVKKNGVIYDLLTTAPTVGNVYVIVNKDAYMGMSTKQNENNRGSVGVMFTDNTKAKVYGNDELALFVLEKADGNRYYFKNINGNGYLTVAGNTGLRTGEADYYASAGVEIGSQADGYPATITFRGDKVRTMRYSANSRTFSTYTDAALNQNVFLYGVNATPLRYIEGEMKAGTEDNPVQVTVSDELIGTWAVKNLLWAKDQGYANVKTFAEEGQQDYVKDILKYQRAEGWDQSNWVILDFTEAAGGADKAAEFVGKKIEMASVTGTYVDDVNYTIQLQQAPELVKDGSGKAIDVSADYPGYKGPIDGVNYNPQAAPTGSYDYAYNTYVPANFLNSNLNLAGNKGFVAQEGAAAPSHVGEQLFFVNPKVMEVARIWAVYAGTGTDGKDIFTVYEPDKHNVNGWGVEGAFSVEWNYNRLDGNNPDYNIGRPNIDGKENVAFLFHAVVASNTAIANAPLRAATDPQADATPSMSSSYRLYPLDFPSDGSNYTAVSEVRGVKTVESVRYYNIMGMESEKPFEGINIVVTRYSDGTTSTAKVLR